MTSPSSHIIYATEFQMSKMQEGYREYDSKLNHILILVLIFLVGEIYAELYPGHISFTGSRAFSVVRLILISLLRLKVMSAP